MRFAERRRERRAGRPHVLLLVAQPAALGAARLPRLLHDAGCRVTLFAERDAVASRAGCLDQHLVAPAPRDGYFDALAAHLAGDAARYDWVLPATDADVRGLYARRAEPWAARCFPADPTSPDAEAVFSKAAFGYCVHNRTLIEQLRLEKASLLFRARGRNQRAILSQRAYLAWGALDQDPSFVQDGDVAAVLGFIQVGSAEQHGERFFFDELQDDFP